MNPNIITVPTLSRLLASITSQNLYPPSITLFSFISIFWPHLHSSDLNASSPEVLFYNVTIYLGLLFRLENASSSFLTSSYSEDTRMSHYPGGVGVTEFHSERWKLARCISTPNSVERILFSESGSYTSGQNNYFRCRINSFIFSVHKSQPL
jgi:hypothetical protein